MTVQILTGDCRDMLRSLPAESVQCCVTSPPYFGLRDYGHDGQIGHEPTPADFVAAMVEVFREVHRVLRSGGTLWLNLGDSYAGSRGAKAPSATSTLRGNGHVGGGPKIRAMTPSQRRDREPVPRSDIAVPGIKPKNLMGIPWRVAFALQDDGWYLRQDIIWHKPNPMPESVNDRCTRSHEYLFLLSKSERYYFNADAIAEPAEYPEGPRNKKAYQVAGQRRGENANLGGNVHKIGPRLTRNRRSVWTISTKPFAGSHFATFPPEIPETCIKASTRIKDVVLDPFGGAGTTGLVADRLGRHAILCELNPEYSEMARARIQAESTLMAEVLT